MGEVLQYSQFKTQITISIHEVEETTHTIQYFKADVSKIKSKLVVPIRDNNPTEITPYVTFGLIAVNVLVFLYEASLPPQALNGFLHLAAVVPRELSFSFAGVDLDQPVPEWATLITSQFLHGGLLHLAGNMLFLWIFGNNVEDKLGHAKYLLFYLSCGILASLTQWFFSQNSNIPSLGASGAIAGVMGAYILRFPQAEILGVILYLAPDGIY